MNKVYKHIWSKTQGRLVVVSECARGAQGRKSGRRKLTVSLIASSLLSGVAWANDLPSGGQIVSGAGSIASNGTSMTINQSSDRMIANWQSFSIGENNAVTFSQPSASSVALNRVVGQDPSQILGSLNANGQVFLLNPNGIAIGSTGSVQTGGFVASTLGMTDEDFLAGKYQFNGNGGTISNQGDINGSVVALIAPSVTNEGTITTGASSDSATGVALAAGTDVLLDFDGDGLLSVEVKANTLAGLVENNGLIQADGGIAILTAKGASDALKGVVNNTGTVQANSIAKKGGRILLLGDMREGQGEVNVAGKLSAELVETSAATVNIDKDLQVDTQGGEWLIDPVNIEIDTAKASAIQTALGSGDVTVTTANGAGWAGETNGTGTDEGNITVNAAIDWAANTLTLRADNDITINAELTSTGTTASDGLVLQYAQTTDTGDYTINAPVNLAAGSLFQTQHASDTAITYTVITDLGTEGSTSGTDLQGVNGGLTGNYVLGADIDASDTATWNAGAGFDPLGGSSSSRFAGRFDGLGHTVSGLTIDITTDHAGLFGYVDSGGVVQNIGIVDGSISGKSRVGGLVGRNKGTISNAYATTSVSGTSDVVGGLVGYNEGVISNAYAAVDVSGSNYVGGLVGYSDGTISNAYATGDVSGSKYVGGLVGFNDTSSATISNSYATGDVSGSEFVGGLVGFAYGSISNVYATGSVAGSEIVGGLVGRNGDSGTISNAYATGSVSGTSGLVGGLVGRSSGTISNAYAIGSVTGSDGVGGLVGYNVGAISDTYATGAVSGSSNTGGLVGFDGAGTITNGYYVTETTGQSDTGKGEAITTIADLTAALPSGFDSAVWQRGHNGYDTSPYLLNIAPSSTYIGSDTGIYTIIRTLAELQAAEDNLGINYALWNDIDASDTATWNAGAGFDPLGDKSTSFTGSFDGFGHTVSGLTIDRATTNYVGLFGYVGSGGVVQNIGMVDGSISGKSWVGGLVGRNDGMLSNAYATGSVSGTTFYVGGLLGYNDGTLSNAYATGLVSGTANFVGGLAGYNDTDATISDTYATGSVSGTHNVGGLVGFSFGSISDTYATGSVSGSNYVGGLVGFNTYALINAYATGAVSGSALVGGLVGSNAGTIGNAYAAGTVSGSDLLVGGLVGRNVGTISDAYATGSVTGGDTVGGLVGYNVGAISDAYATGSVSGDTEIGGLVGENDTGTIANSYWNTETSGQASAIGTDDNSQSATGLTTAEMLNFVNYSGFDSSIWGIHEGETSAYLLALDRHSVLLADGEAYLSVSTLDELQAINDDLSSNYVLWDDIDASDTATWNSGAGFDPLGDNITSFTGSFYGLGHTVSDLTINRSTTDYVGLFGSVGSGGVVQNIGIVDGSISGGAFVGGLVGYNLGSITDAYATGAVVGESHYVGGLVGRSAGTISNAYATGTVVGGGDLVGGLVGENEGTIDNAYATGTVDGEDSVGGLVGENEGTIDNAHATGTVDGEDYVGGLVGLNAGTIGNAYATGTVDGRISVGGLVGLNHRTLSNVYASGEVSGISDVGGLAGTSAGAISYAYATGNVTGIDDGGFSFIGGLVGFSSDAISYAYATGNVTGSGAYGGGLVGYGETISNAYATGSVTGSDFVGGLAGYTDGAISYAYATGNVTGSGTDIGGLVGNSDKDITDSFWNTETSGQATSAGGTGLTTLEMQDPFTFIDAGWDFEGVWGKSPTLENSGYMMLRGLTAGALYDDYIQLSGNASKTYGDDNPSLSGITLHGLGTGNITLTWNAGITNTTDVGTYAYADGDVIDVSTSSAGGVYSDYGADGLTVDKAALTLTASDQSKTYGDTFSFAGDEFTSVGLQNGETVGSLMLTSAATSTTANAGSHAITAASATGGTFDIGNYDVTYNTGSFTVDKAALTVTANDASKIYDGLAFTGGNGVTYSGFVNSETDSVLGGTLAYGGTAQSAVNAGTYTLTASGQTSDNYSITYSGGTLEVDKAALSVTANDANKTYDGLAFNGGNGVTYAGFVTGEDDSVLGGTLAYGGDAQDAVNAGSYTLSASGLTADNYEIAYIDGALTVDKAALTLTANDQSKTYGDAFSFAGIEFASIGLQNGETVGSVMLTSAATSTTANAGSHGITAASATGGTFAIGNYDVTYNTGTFLVDKAALTVTANDASKTYDGLAFSSGNGVTYSGFVNSEADSVLGGTLAYGGTAQTAVNAGTYTLTASGQTSDNYSITYIGGTLAVDKAALSVTANNANKTYDGLAFSGGNGVTYAGFMAGEDDSVLGGSLTYGGTAQDAVNAGSYRLTASGLTSGNYDFSYADGMLTVSKAVISAITGLTASDKVYDGTTVATLDTSAVGFSGLISGDSLTLASAAGAFTDKNAGTGKTVDITGLSLGGADVGNYTLASTMTSTTADIAKAAISVITGIIANGKIYDGTIFAALNTSGAGFTGMVEGDALTIASGKGAFGDADPGFDKSVAITGLSLGGSDAANYVLADTTAEASATIFAPSTATYLLPEQAKRTSLAEFDGRTETLLGPGPELIEVQATSDNQNGG